MGGLRLIGMLRFTSEPGEFVGTFFVCAPCQPALPSTACGPAGGGGPVAPRGRCRRRSVPAEGRELGHYASAPPVSRGWRRRELLPQNGNAVV
eukprot:3486471-Pyramimonas_sp.AAC.1